MTDQKNGTNKSPSNSDNAINKKSSDTEKIAYSAIPVPVDNINLFKMFFNNIVSKIKSILK
jgi:hypothetical protein